MSESIPYFQYRGVVLRVIDGDTVQLRVDLGCDIRIDMTCRMYGIDAPEMATREGKAAKTYLESILGTEGSQKPVVVHTFKDRKEKYGRYLVTLFVDEINVNIKMVEEGHAELWSARKLGGK